MYEMIKQDFIKGGFLYRLIAEGRNGLVYEQKSKKGVIVSYEVHKIRLRHNLSIQNIKFGSIQRMPSNNDFGVWAWSINDLERAMAKFQKLEEKNTKVKNSTLVKTEN